MGQDGLDFCPCRPCDKGVEGELFQSGCLFNSGKAVLSEPRARAPHPPARGSPLGLKPVLFEPSWSSNGREGSWLPRHLKARATVLGGAWTMCPVISKNHLAGSVGTVEHLGFWRFLVLAVNLRAAPELTALLRAVHLRCLLSLAFAGGPH